MPKSLRGRLLLFTRIPFVRGVATFQVGTVVMTITGFASSVLYARLLGLHEFGIYAAVTAFAGLLGIFTSYGQETATITFLSEAVGRRDKKGIALVLRYFLQATSLATLVYIALFLLAPVIATMVGSDPRIGMLARLVLLNAVLQPVNVLLFIALQLQRRIALVAFLENALDILQLSLAIVLLLLGWGVAGILAAQLLGMLAAVPLFLALYVRSARAQGFPTLRESIGGMHTASGTGPYARQGLWIALDRSISGNLYPNLFFVLLNATTTPATVGVFRIALRLATLPLSLLMPSITRMTAVAIPRIAAADPRHLLRSCQQVLIGAVALSFLATIGAAIVVPPLIPLVYGAEFARVIPIFLLILPINITSSMHVVSVPILRILRRVWVITLTNGTGIVLACGLYFLLLQSLPVLGAVGASVIFYHSFSLLLFVYLGVLYRHRSSLAAAKGV